jgi:hypothetical protein
VLTGKVTHDGKASKVDGRTIAVADWNDDVGNKACGRRIEPRLAPPLLNETVVRSR